MRLGLLMAAALLLLPAPAAAWWDYGHHTVARIAQMSVRPSTARAMNRLLRQGALLETPQCPLRTIEDASEWADCVPRDRERERFGHTSPWHYQNISICKPFDPNAACKDGNCVSAQVERQARLLGNGKLPVRERVAALAFLIHFVGDLHMPLHVADRGDRGGNDLPASYGLIGGRVNLHMIWDGYVAERAISTPSASAAGILGELPPNERRRIKLGTVADWSWESWQAGRDLAYGSLMADPCGAKPGSRPVIDEAATQRLIPIVRRQIARGGLRLARLLDEVLG